MSAAPVDRGSEVSTLGRRLGPVVAAVGVLLTAVVLAWVVVAPDNVVGPVEEAPFALEATAVTVTADGDCLRLVGGDGTASELCPAWAGGRVHAVWWEGTGRLVADGADGLVAVDPATGEVTRLDPEADSFPGDTGPGADPEAVHPDGSVVRAGPWDTDGEVVLDLGGPVTRLEGAVLSPDGEVVVAVDSRQRVVVAEVDDPTAVYVWFEASEGAGFDPYGGVDWSG